MKELNPIAPITGDPIKKKVTAKGVNEGASSEGLTLSENEFGDAAANRIFRESEKKSDALVSGKYGRLDLFEEGPVRDGSRTLRYRDGVRKPYNNDAIKANVLPYYQERNPGVKMSFDYEYGGDLEPTSPII